MLTLLKWAILAAGLAAVVAFVPINGRTALTRWHEAKSASVFAERTWQELKKTVTSMTDRQLGRHAKAERSEQPERPAARPPAKPATRPIPVERYTDADRKALDKIVAEHVKH